MTPFPHSVAGDNPQALLAVRNASPESTVMHQSWCHLLFLHWKVSADEIAKTLPSGLSVETFDGTAWVGLVPFAMRRVRPVGMPCVPGLSDFLELNVRTYVRGPDGRPGVWFYSLDCNQALAVRIARGLFHLPYLDARMSLNRRLNGHIVYDCERCGSGHGTHFEWKPRGTALEAQAGTLEFFLLERYLLFSCSGGRLPGIHAGRVSHAPYRFRQAKLDAFDPWAIGEAGLSVPAGEPDSLLAVDRVDVRIHPLRSISNPSHS